MAAGRATSYSDYFKGKTPRSVIDRIRRGVEDDDEDGVKKIPELPSYTREKVKKPNPLANYRGKTPDRTTFGKSTAAVARAEAIKRRLMKKKAG